MNTNPNPYPGTLAEEDIHAYVDGHLEAERRAEIEAYLAAHPAEARRVEDYRAQNIRLHALFDAHRHEPIPPSLQYLQIQLGGALRRQRAVRKTARLLGSVTVLALAWVAGYWGYQNYEPRTDPLVAFTKEAAEAHLLYAGRSGIAPAQGETGDFNVVAWLSQRVTGAPLREPNLESFGFSFVRGRILPTANGPAAQLLYRDKEGVPVTLYISASQNKRQTRFTFVQEGSNALFYWQNANFAYSLIGELDKDKLLQIAQLISKGLSAAQESVKEAAGPASDQPAKAAKRSVAAEPTQDPASASTPKAEAKSPAPALSAPVPAVDTGTDAAVKPAASGAGAEDGTSPAGAEPDAGLGHGKQAPSAEPEPKAEPMPAPVPAAPAAEEQQKES
ncbi:MAG: hypothetical protein QNJ94_02265 [Alphaproteobacteria bacterium]|nr:hypothetical protein [Alphaproteobacteria bacterium]